MTLRNWGQPGPSGSVGGTGAANRVAFWTAGTTLSSSANLTFVNGTKTLNVAGGGSGGKFAVDEIDLGATPFVFKDTAGVLQVGDPLLTWDSAFSPPHLGVAMSAADVAAVLNALGSGSDEHLVIGNPDARVIQPSLLLHGKSVDFIGQGAELIFTAQGGTLAAPSSVPAGTPMGSLDFMPYISGNYIKGTGAFEGVAGMTAATVDGSGNSCAALYSGGGGNNNQFFVSLDAAGNWVPGGAWFGTNDNLQDHGASANRWRTGYFGTSVVSPLFSVASGAGNSGITTTITTASLVGKTITVQGGIITGFA